MLLQYPSHIAWSKDVPTSDLLANFGKNTQQNLRSSLNRIKDTTITYTVLPAGVDFLSWFIPMYADNLLAKDNPVVFPIAERVLSGRHEYFALTLYEDGVPIGGILFFITESGYISTAYRTYLANWRKYDLRASPSLYAEYLLEEYARTIGAVKIIHGRDRNLYGVNSGIGVALFKLMVGCQPGVSKTHEVLEFDAEKCNVDTLIFKYPEPNTGPITEAYLITAPETANKWSAVTKYGERLQVSHLVRQGG